MKVCTDLFRSQLIAINTLMNCISYVIRSSLFGYNSLFAIDYDNMICESCQQSCRLIDCLICLIIRISYVYCILLYGHFGVGCHPAMCLDGCVI